MITAKLCLNMQCTLGTITYNFGNVLLLSVKPYMRGYPEIELTDVHGETLKTTSIYDSNTELGMVAYILEDIIDESSELVSFEDWDNMVKEEIKLDSCTVTSTKNATGVTYTGSTKATKNITVRSAVVCLKVLIGGNEKLVIVDNFSFAKSEEEGYSFKEGDPIAISYTLVMS
ncbi:MAG: hypothetical protein QXQ90_09875 [Desulfurococcaceae archaeon]